MRWRTRRVQKYKRTQRPARRSGAEFIYHYRGERNHQGLGNAFVFLDRSASSEGWHVQWERVPPGKKLVPRSLSHVRGGNETDEAD